MIGTTLQLRHALITRKVLVSVSACCVRVSLCVCSCVCLELKRRRVGQLPLIIGPIEANVRQARTH